MVNRLEQWRAALVKAAVLVAQLEQRQGGLNDPLYGRAVQALVDAELYRRAWRDAQSTTPVQLRLFKEIEEVLSGLEF